MPSGEGGPVDPPDDVLVLRVARGDRDALETLVRRYIRAIHAVAASYLSEPADVEDAAQETFLRVLDGFGRYDPARPFAPWLYQIARNVARNRLRSAARLTTLEESMRDTSRADPAEAAERSDVRRRVDAAIARLPEQRRTAFRLCDVDGYATAEVARLMGLSEGTVRSHVHHARRALRATLAAPLGEASSRGGANA